MLLIIDESQKKRLEFLKDFDKEAIKEFCRLAVDNLKNGANQKIIQSTAQTLNMELDLVQNGISGIAYLLIEACKLKIEELELRDSLLVFGFSEDNQQEIVSSYLENKEEIRSLLSSFKIDIPYYHNLEWRIDVQISSRSLRRPAEPIVKMCLELERANDISHVILETDPVNLLHMADILDQALQQAKSQHTRRIMRLVK